jgi:hypothetical protein
MATRGTAAGFALPARRRSSRNLASLAAPSYLASMRRNRATFVTLATQVRVSQCQRDDMTHFWAIEGPGRAPAHRGRALCELGFW